MRAACLLALVACGGGNPAKPDGTVAGSDGSGSGCQPIGATGQFYRRTPEPRLLAGAMGDGNSLGDPDLLFDGTTWHLYYGTSNGGAIIVRHATSTDLVAWTIDPNPAVQFASNASVTKTPAGFFMMHDNRTSLEGATSTDGSAWNNAGFTGTGFDANATLADPEVVYVAGTYHLWFAIQSATVVGIGHATSTDGVAWTVVQWPVKSLSRLQTDDKTGGRAPSVIYDAPHCRWEMWLVNDQAGDTSAQTVQFANMAGVWHATSMDAMTWQLYYTSPRDFSWMATAAGEHLGMRRGADVAANGNARYLIYTGYDDQNVPSGFTLPTAGGTTSAVMTLDLATRDAP